MSETTLHRQLKELYAGPTSVTTDGDVAADVRTEVKLGRYRIDVVRDRELIEIQHGSLAAIRAKVIALTSEHQVRVVKPIVARKHLIKRAARGRRIVDRRLSPKRGQLLDVFAELVYFRQAFPHPRLVLEVPLVVIEEWRFPGHGRRRWRHQRDHQVEDQRLVEVLDVHEFRTAEDLVRLLDVPLPDPFHSRHLADSMSLPLHFAQKILYALREMGAIEPRGKLANARLYGRP
jgi:hypothetical protein